MEKFNKKQLRTILEFAQMIMIDLLSEKSAQNSSITTNGEDLNKMHKILHYYKELWNLTDKDEEMLNIGGGRVISKKNYQKALNDFWEAHKDDKSEIKLDDKIVGILTSVDPITIELNSYGKQVLGNDSPIYGVSSRKAE